MPLLVPFVLLLLWGVWSYSPGSSPLSWVLTIMWSLPAVGALVGVQGAWLTRHQIRRDTHAVPSPLSEHHLIILVPTIGRRDTYPALRRSVFSYLEYLPAHFPRLRVDIVTEEACEAAELISELAALSPLVRMVVVPQAYRTTNRSRFKARANHYSHELRISEGEARSDVWVLHMDDDTGVGPDTAYALARFINRQRQVGPEDAKHLAQGILVYPRENAANLFTWLADSIRPADDIARFRALTGIGTPAAGVHGELLLIRASIEATIGWDFGPTAIVEDTQFALSFCRCYPGRSGWFNGRCYGASPSNVRDFVKQRDRWSWGLVTLCFDREIPLRYRWFLAVCVATWILGPFQHVGTILLVAWITGSLQTSPVTPSIVVVWAFSFAYTIWTYWEGLRLNALASANGRRKWWEPIAVVALIPVFSVLEGIGGFTGFLKFVRRREKEFVVISKPD